VIGAPTAHEAAGSVPDVPLGPALEPPAAPAAPAAADPPANPDPPPGLMPDGWLTFQNAVSPAVPDNQNGFMPASPFDQEGVYRGLLWVVEAALECGRMFAGLARQLAGFEQRLEALESRRSDEGRDTEFRISVVEQRVLEVEAFSPWIEQVQQALDDFARAQADEAEAAAAVAAQRELVPVAPEPAAPAVSAVDEVEPLLAELRAEIVEARRRERVLEVRLAQLEAQPTMEQVAAEQFHRLAAQLPGAQAEIEGVYRELDSVAEQVAQRDAVVTRSLQRLGPLEKRLAPLEKRLGPLEKYVDGLRDDLGRVAAQLAALAGVDVGVVEWMGNVDARMTSLESSAAIVERLRVSLDRVSEELAAPRARGDGVEPQPEGGSEAGAEMSEPPVGDTSMRAIKALTAELDRISKSIEALSGEDAS
ncbi:MAG: hypothetical protein ACR2HV_10060, partial [Acidimicrobiales bacterium]